LIDLYSLSVYFRVLIEMRATDNKTRENIVLAMQRKEKRYNISLWLNVSLSTIDL
jgi:hypothetical protein